jgi:hypothetical protein
MEVDLSSYSPRSRDLCKDHLRDHTKAVTRAEPITKAVKLLLPHERELLEKGELKNITHKGKPASASLHCQVLVPYGWKLSPLCHQKERW